MVTGVQTTERTKVRCGAKTVSGGQCRNWGTGNKGRCRWHGGKTPIGPTHPGYKHGRYSKVVPNNLLSDYQDALDRGDAILSSVDDIALIESRVNDLLRRLGSGESGELWRRLRITWDEFMTAVRTGDSELQATLANDVGTMIRRGAGEWAMWGEVGAQVDRLSRLRQSERKHETEIQAQVPVDVVLLLLAQVVRTAVESIKAHADQATAKRVIVEINEAYQGALGPGSNG